MGRIRTAGLTAVAAALVAVPSAPAWGAQSVPFTDTNDNGSITFCGRNGQAVTSGSLTEQPFVWKAISSAPAPAQYTRAYLVLYQPIQNVDPGDWTGYTLTNVATFSNAAHPAVQSTNIDLPLLDPDRQIPPVWDGLYQVRMFFTGLGRPVYTETYPAAVIRVTGSTWELVSGGGTSCAAGQAVSATSQIANAKALATPQTIAVGGVPVAGGASSQPSTVNGRPSSRVTTPPSSTGTGPAGPTTTSLGGGDARTAAPPAQARAVTNHGDGGSSGGLITGVVVAVAAVGATALVLVRRRRAVAS